MTDEDLAEQVDMRAVVPDTDYFELVGGRFAIWVTRPSQYDAEPDVTYPTVYLTDGSFSVGRPPRR